MSITDLLLFAEISVSSATVSFMLQNCFARLKSALVVLKDVFFYLLLNLGTCLEETL